MTEDTVVQKVNEIIPEELKVSREATTWKFEFTSEKMTIFFGNFVEEKTVEVNSLVSIPYKRLNAFLESLLDNTIDANDEYKLNLKLFNCIEKVEEPTNEKGEE